MCMEQVWCESKKFGKIDVKNGAGRVLDLMLDFGLGATRDKM